MVFPENFDLLNVDAVKPSFSQGLHALTVLDRFRKDERGATIVEIALVASLSVVAILTVYGSLMSK
jgi:Flp pilus assembly pilin Flp